MKMPIENILKKRRRKAALGRRLKSGVLIGVKLPNPKGDEEETESPPPPEVFARLTELADNLPPDKKTRAMALINELRGILMSEEEAEEKPEEETAEESEETTEESSATS